MTIHIVTVGAKPAQDAAGMTHEFLKRLPAHIQVKWSFVKHGVGSPSVSKQQEAESILRTIPAKMKMILLDENGKQLSSPELAKELFMSGHDVVFVIGGAYGVDDRLKARADIVLSLGRMVFPHQLVRIILAEQIYRAHAIHSGHPYHHD